MIEFFKILIEGVKLGGKFSPVILLVITSILLFAPDTLVGFLHIINIKNNYVEVIGLGFVTSIAVVILQLCIWINNTAIKPYFDKIKLHNRLKFLSSNEKEILRNYIFNDQKTLYFGITDGEAAGLLHSKILYRPNGYGNLISGIAYNIQPWAYEHLKQNTHLIEE